MGQASSEIPSPGEMAMFEAWVLQECKRLSPEQLIELRGLLGEMWSNWIKAEQEPQE